MHPYLALPTPHLFGHRGASGEAPENTLESFELAWSQGVPFLEMDCHGTKDGEIVVMHDAELDRTTQASGPVRSCRWDELAALDAGYRFSPDGESFPYRGKGVRVPRLREVLAAFPEARVNLEIKQGDPPIATEVLRLIREADAVERVLLAAEDEQVMAQIRALDPPTGIGMCRGDVVEFFQSILEGRIEAYRAPGDALQIPPEFMGQPLITSEMLEAARSVGLRVHVWTINDPDQMRSLLQLGVDGLMSDYPGRLVDVARSVAR
jgi:glycerophosphoryl diester phosphodiesterase